MQTRLPLELYYRIGRHCEADRRNIDTLWESAESPARFFESLQGQVSATVKMAVVAFAQAHEHEKTYTDSDGDVWRKVDDDTVVHILYDGLARRSTMEWGSKHGWEPLSGMKSRAIAAFEALLDPVPEPEKTYTAAELLAAKQASLPLSSVSRSLEPLNDYMFKIVDDSAVRNVSLTVDLETGKPVSTRPKASPDDLMHAETTARTKYGTLRGFVDPVWAVMIAADIVTASYTHTAGRIASGVGDRTGVCNTTEAAIFGAILAARELGDL